MLSADTPHTGPCLQHVLNKSHWILILLLILPLTLKTTTPKFLHSAVLLVYECPTHLHEGNKALIFLLPALDELQCEGLVTAKGSDRLFNLLLLCSTELYASNMTTST